MRSAPSVGRGFSPLDEELELGSEHLTPFVRESVVRLATWMSFARAGGEVAHFTGVQVSATTARRLTERAGAAYERVQTAEVARIERELPAPPEGPAVQYLSVDGAMVPLVGGVWAEVKTLALGEVVVRAARTRRDRDRTVHAQRLSYFSRLADHDTFAHLATVETQRRGTETAGVVCAVADGAPWIQAFIDLHRPDAVRILDWPHALGYVAQAGSAIYGPDTPAAHAWLAHQRRLLLEEDPALVLAELRRLRGEVEAVASSMHGARVWAVTPDGVAPSASLRGVLGQEAARRALAVVQDSLTYLEPRAAHLRYAAFRAADYPLGSGSVESANKLLVEERLKGAGMHWARAHVNPMVALRTVAYGDRWAEAWPQITAQQRHQARTLSADRRTARARAAHALAEETQSVAPTTTTRGRPTASPRRPTPTPHGRRLHKPAADHPWRRMPVGRPQCA